MSLQLTDNTNDEKDNNHTIVKYNAICVNKSDGDNNKDSDGDGGGDRDSTEDSDRGSTEDSDSDSTEDSDRDSTEDSDGWIDDDSNEEEEAEEEKETNDIGGDKEGGDKEGGDKEGGEKEKEDEEKEGNGIEILDDNIWKSVKKDGDIGGGGSVVGSIGIGGGVVDSIGIGGGDIGIGGGVVDSIGIGGGDIGIGGGDISIGSSDGGGGGDIDSSSSGSSSIFLEDITGKLFKEKEESDKYITDNNKIIFIKNKNIKNINIKNDADGEGIIDYMVDVLTSVINKLIYCVKNFHYNNLVHYLKSTLNYLLQILISLYNLFTNNNTKNTFNSIKNGNKHKDIFIKNKPTHKKHCKCNKHRKHRKTHKKVNSYLDTEKKIFLLKN